MAPKYRLLADRLRAEIKAGSARGGGRLPSERELAAVHKVSRQTVRQALALLAQEGILEKKRGSGSFAVRTPSGKRRRIAFLLPADESCMPRGAVQEIESVCEAQDYDIKFYFSGGSIVRERKILQAMKEDPAEGICAVGIRTALPNPNIDLYKYLKNAGAAVMFAGSPYRGLEDMNAVSMDNTAGGYLAVRYLMSQGHARIACLFEDSDMQDLERYGGCVSAVRDYGLELAEDCYFWIPRQDPASCGEDAAQGGGAGLGGAAGQGEGAGQGKSAGTPRSGGRAPVRRGEFWDQAALRIAGGCSAAICRDRMTAMLLADALREKDPAVFERFGMICFRDEPNPEDGAADLPSLVCAGPPPVRVAADCLLRMLAGKTVSPVRLSWRLVPFPGRES